MKIPGIFLVLLLIAGIISSCKKDRIAQPLNEYGSLQQFYDDHEEPEQEFIINGDGDCAINPIIGMRGTRLCIGKDNLIHLNNDSVIYPFSIRLVELYTPRHMILYRMPNVSDNTLIGTGGEIRVRATKGNDNLLLRQNHLYFAQMPTASPVGNMSVYYGRDMGSFHNWTTNLAAVAPGLSVAGTITIDSSNAFYNLQLPYLGWNGPGFPYTYTSAQTTVSFDSPTDDLTNVAKFLYYGSIPSVMQVYGNTSGQIPVGVPVQVICFARDAQGGMHFSSQQITPTAGQVIMVTLAPTTETALLSLLDSL